MPKSRTKTVAKKTKLSKITSPKIKRKPVVSKASKRVVKRIVRQKRPIHRRILLHPVGILFILCLGVLLIGLTYKVIADNIIVTAVVPATPLEAGAIITSPYNDQIILNQNIYVEGTCPQDSYVELSDNGVFSGVAWCTSDTFQVLDSLYQGQNTLSATDYNETNDQGPASASVEVTYDTNSNYNTNTHSTGAPSSSSSHSSTTHSLPLSSSSSSSPSSSSSSSQNSGHTGELPPVLSSNYTFQLFTTNTKFNWTIDLVGGTPPYNININWGDGQNSSFIYRVDAVIPISHVYQKAGYYPVIVRTTDAAGFKNSMQLAALIKQPGQSTFVGTVSSTTPNSTSSKTNAVVTKLESSSHWLLLAWPSYLIVILMAVSFWLGEKQEYFEILRIKTGNRKRSHGRV